MNETWYTEIWTNEDLEAALENAGIPTTDYAVEKVNYSDTSNRASCFSHSGYCHIPACAGQFSRYVHKRLGSGSPCPTMQGFTRISGSAGLPAGY